MHKSFNATISQRGDGTFTLHLGTTYFDGEDFQIGFDTYYGNEDLHNLPSFARAEEIMFTVHHNYVLNNEHTPPEPVFGCAKFWHYQTPTIYTS